jgi:hypothetical protein
LLIFRHLTISLSPSLGWISTSVLHPFPIEDSDPLFKCLRMLGSSFDKIDLRILHRATCRISFVVRCGLGIDKISVALWIIIVLEEGEASFRKLGRTRAVSVSISCIIKTVTYTLPIPILRTNLICCSDTTGNPTFLLVSLLEVMMDEVIIKLDKEHHVLGVRQVRSKVGIGMRYKGLLECVESNYATGSVVQRIRC